MALMDGNLKFRLSRKMFVATAMACLVHMVSCQPKSLVPGKLPQGSIEQFPYRPVEISIHPLSRYWISPSGEMEIEARIEFLDRDGYPTRGIGRLELNLKDLDGKNVESWILPLSNFETNKSHFDRITRTYLIRLSLPNQDVPTRARLKVDLICPDGTTLTASDVLKEPQKPDSTERPQEPDVN
ncbi:MAG: hypothetical protein CMJ40_05645 [Phycisphaerae bacterium]|nr:hypothetical protein [Phycisphaerae bacterium]|tara:strand:- start:816 stop:1367 length:552 start_codon:yes stop_codon:yes gene_type:complete